MEQDITIYLAKATESLLTAESEFANGRYNNAANRAYYACFQAALAALMRAGIRTPSPSGQWSHEFVWGGGSSGFRFGIDHDFQSALFQRRQFGKKLLFLFGGKIDAQDSGELATQMHHAALQPISTMIGDEGCERID